jgi:hypothetical protein
VALNWLFPYPIYPSLSSHRYKRSSRRAVEADGPCSAEEVEDVKQMMMDVSDTSQMQFGSEVDTLRSERESASAEVSDE